MKHAVSTLIRIVTDATVLQANKLLAERIPSDFPADTTAGLSVEPPMFGADKAFKR
jgi:hypothetical protein